MTRPQLRLPAEWEEQKATWLVWPHNVFNWGHKLSNIRDYYFRLISILLKHQDVHLLISDEQQQIFFSGQAYQNLNRTSTKIHFHNILTNTIWIRDFGPFFRANNSIFITGFNSWGKKFQPWNLDSQVAQQILQLVSNRNLAGFQSTSHSQTNLIFEGGALEVNGQGIGLTTATCLDDLNRNSRFKISQLKSKLQTEFGIHHLIILPDGLKGDHTDGHIDNFARFISPTILLLVVPSDPHDPNFEGMMLNYLILRKQLPEIEIQIIPPVPPQNTDDTIIPRSYANFIFVNGALIYPSYHDPISELTFRSILEKHLPNREIIGVPSELLISEGGSLHCMTKNQ